MHRALSAWRTGRTGVIAVLLALAMRLLVPAGFMWAPATDGTPSLILCNGVAPGGIAAMAGMGAMHHLAGHNHMPGHEDGDGDHACAFAAFGGVLDLGTDLPTIVPIAPIAAAIALVVARIASPGRGLAAPPPPQRGPPATF